METEITVVMSVHNVEKHIRASIQSLLARESSDLQLLIVEDPPFDSTREILNTFRDPRIRYVRNQAHLGLSASRNISVKLASGRYIFFTDADCIASPTWVEQGLDSLADPLCAAVEGRTYYVSETYESTYSDDVIENHKGGDFMTCNMVYKRAAILEAGGFDERYTRMEDRDLALRVTKLGKIDFNPDMIVYHQKRAMKPGDFVRRGRHIRNRVLLYKKFRERDSMLWRIVFPVNLLSIMVPPLILRSLLRNRFETKDDFLLLPFIYAKMVYERLCLWQMSAKERTFLI